MEGDPVERRGRGENPVSQDLGVLEVWLDRTRVATLGRRVRGEEPPVPRLESGGRVEGLQPPPQDLRLAFGDLENPRHETCEEGVDRLGAPGACDLMDVGRVVRVAEQHGPLGPQSRDPHEHLSGVVVAAQTAPDRGAEDLLPQAAVLEGLEHRLGGRVRQRDHPALQSAIDRGLAQACEVLLGQARQPRRVRDVDGGGVPSGDEQPVEVRRQRRQLGVELPQPGLLLLGQADPATLVCAEPLGEDELILLVETESPALGTLAHLGEPRIQSLVEEDRVGVPGQPRHELGHDRLTLLRRIRGLGHPEGRQRAIQGRPTALPGVQDVLDVRRVGVVGERAQRLELLGHAHLERLAHVRAREDGIVGQRERQGRGTQERVGHRPIPAHRHAAVP